MIGANDLTRIIEALGEQGQDDIRWAERLESPEDNFAGETIFVICNSGMRHTVAREIFRRVMAALRAGQSARTVFGHKDKAAAIDRIWAERLPLLIGFLQAPDRLAYCGTLPWIGEITRYHLAKNFGVDVAKPDVHLQRLADLEGVTAQQLCERLARETGLRIATVDTVLWRACATGVLDSRTGEMRAAA